MPLVQSNPNGYLHPDVKPKRAGDMGRIQQNSAIGSFMEEMKRRVNVFNPDPKYDTVRQEMADNLQAQFGGDTGMLGAGLDASQPMRLPGVVGMFAGVGAKTANITKLRQAQKMADEGMPDDVIHATTGWFEGMPDKKWRFEIPDNRSRSTDGIPYGKKSQDELQDVLHHPGLYKAYPELRSLEYVPVSGNEISYYPGTGTIVSGSPASNTSNLHEVQHAIQQREGFSRGGAASEFRTQRTPDAILASSQRFRLLRAFCMLADVFPAEAHCRSSSWLFSFIVRSESSTVDSLKSLIVSFFILSHLPHAHQPTPPARPQ